MKTGQFLGVKCFYLDNVPTSLITKHHIYKITDLTNEYYQLNGRRFKVFLERDIAQRVLLEGKGIYYRDYVFFSKSASRSTLCFVKFLKDLNAKEEEYKEYLGGVLFRLLKEPNIFPLVKAIVDLYHTNFLTKEQTMERLKKYLEEADCKRVLSA